MINLALAISEDAADLSDEASSKALVQALIATLNAQGHLPLPDINRSFHLNMAERAERLEQIDWLCREASNDTSALRLIHDLMARLYDTRFQVPKGAAIGSRPSAESEDILVLAEHYLLARENASIEASFDAGIPQNGEAFLPWLLDLIDSHPAKHHPFYESFLGQASKDDIIEFCIQETTLDPRFDDVLALLQIGTPDKVKLEIAHNYWDEMGNGDIGGLHTNMFRQALTALGVTEQAIKPRLGLESIICGNLSMMLALHRCHFHKAIGYFGVTEFLVPFRFNHVIAAWQRLGLEEKGVYYYQLHHEIDAGHGIQWFHNVIKPIIDADASSAIDIGRGALYRLNSSQRYLDALLKRVQQ